MLFWINNYMQRNELVDNKLDNIRNLGEQLVPYNFPLSIGAEEDINILKKMELEVDGYSILVYFNKSRYNGYYLETFQILGKNTPFLPFSLVVKLGCRFLGGHHLSLVEFYQENRKIYCWSLCVDDQGKPMSSPLDNDSLPCKYEGFEYLYMNPNSLNFY